MQKQFIITAKVQDELLLNIFDNLRKIEQVLNQHISLFAYGKTVKRIVFVFVAVRATNTKHENYIHYHKSSKELTLQQRLDSKKIAKGDVSSNLLLMIERFLQTLEVYSQQSPRKLNASSDILEEFDLSKLRKDIVDLFEAEGWLLREAA